jgi:RNA polymerase sigma-70 factor (ECF subfamily)
VQLGNEKQVIELASRAGDRQAFAALAERYWSPVFRWLFGLTRDSHLAEDLTQEAFFRAWRGLPSFDRSASFRAWLFSIARNCLIDKRRGPRGMLFQVLPLALAGATPGPEALALDRESQVLFRQACRRLPDHFQEAFLLWAQNDMSFAEIAQALSITEQTARWRVFKARLRLVKELGSYLDRKPL